MQNINQSHICLNNTVLNAIQFYGFNSNLNICQDFDDKIAFSSLLKGALVINSSDQVDISINTVSDDECGLGVDDVGCAQDIYMFDKEALETAYLLLSDESRMIWERFYNIKTKDIIKNNL